MRTTKFNFANNFRANVHIKDLEALGWELNSTYEEVAEAKGITEEEAKEWENENYHIDVRVDDEGKNYLCHCEYRKTQ